MSQNPVQEVVAAVVRANGAFALAMLDEVKQRDPAMRADVERALAAGATLAVAARFCETRTELVLELHGATGKTFEVARIATEHVAVSGLH